MIFSTLQQLMARLKGAYHRNRVVYGLARAPGMTARSALGLRGSSLVRLADHGFPTPIFIRQTFSDEAVAFQVFGKGDYDLNYRVPPKTIIDAGANIGLVSLYLSRRFPGARIVAVEPDPENFAMLSLNTAQNPNIITLQAAVWDKRQEVRLFDPGRGSWALQARSVEAASTGTGANPEMLSTSVQAVTIPDLLEVLGTDSVDLLKMDIEGAEREVLQDASAWIGAVSQIVIELHEHLSPGCTAAFASATSGFRHREKKGENHHVAR